MINNMKGYSKAFNKVYKKEGSIE